MSVARCRFQELTDRLPSEIQVVRHSKDQHGEQHLRWLFHRRGQRVASISLEHTYGGHLEEERMSDSILLAKSQLFQAWRRIRGVLCLWVWDLLDLEALAKLHGICLVRV